MRRLAALVFAALLCAAAGACAGSEKPKPQVAAPALPRTAWIVGANGAVAGQASFTEGPHGVLIRLLFVSGALSPGWHGLHFHSVGNCSDPAAGFQASGGPVGMGPRVRHGLMNPQGPEDGDLPNIFAPPIGPFGAEILAPHVTLAAAEHRARLLDADGSALVIHAGPDDQVSQPVGGAGPRVACAALTTLP